MGSGKRRPIIEHWEQGKLFGASVITGYVEGRRVTALFRWSSAGRFGISRESLGTEEILKEGRANPYWLEAAFGSNR